jgi:hypothetical protein
MEGEGPRKKRPQGEHDVYTQSISNDQRDAARDYGDLLRSRMSGSGGSLTMRKASLYGVMVLIVTAGLSSAQPCCKAYWYSAQQERLVQREIKAVAKLKQEPAGQASHVIMIDGKPRKYTEITVGRNTRSTFPDRKLVLVVCH